MWTLSQNKNYAGYKFNYYWINEFAERIYTIYYGIADKGFIEIDKKYLFDQSIEILTACSDMLVAMDKLLTDDNLIAFTSVASTLNEYIIKFALIATSDEKKDAFNNWESISMYKMYSKLEKTIPNKELLEEIDSKYFNDVKHLNKRDVLEFHMAATNQTNLTLDGEGTIDNNAYHFVIMEQVSKAIKVMIVSVYFNNPIWFTSSDYIDTLESGGTPEDGSQYIAAPRFITYIEKEYSQKQRALFLDGDNVIIK